MKHYRYILAAAVLTASSALCNDKLPELSKPLNIPLLLSGNFGELRNNHFHSGIDIKTQGRIGLPVFSVDDGYVSRIVVSPWGFGRAVYVTHPASGLTTVYGHLDSFSPKIDKTVRKMQYEREQFSIDTEFKPDELPVKRGEEIGKSGNAGSSGGPHLHLDVRDMATGEALDPLTYFRRHITDNAAPEVRALALYPVKGYGAVDGSDRPAVHTPAEIGKPYSAWGRVIPAIKAYDRMSGTHNIYGIKHMTLKVDGKTVYNRTIDRFSFDNTRAIHTLVDNDGVVNHGSWMMWTLVPPSAPLDGMVTSSDGGVIDINEERDYKCEWILADEYGNTRRVPFTIQGRISDIAEVTPTGDRLDYKGRNTYSGDGIKVDFPAGTFYSDIDFAVDKSASAEYLTPIYHVGARAVPLSGSYSLTVDLPDDTIEDESKYLMVRINGKRVSRVDSRYEDGRVIGTPSALGNFAVTTDTKAPKILPEAPARWSKTGVIKVKISDNLSGISTYRGEIDGKFALFELDGKTGRLSFRMDASRWTRGTKHDLVITVTDACGNSARHESKFTW